MSLTNKQAMFVKEYLVDLNATQAAIRAGYSSRWAGTNSDKLLKNTNIAAAIREQTEKRSERLEITADRVLQELAKLAFGNIQNVYGADGQLIPPQDLPEEVAATITEVTERQVTSDGQAVVVERKYKLSDKRAALVDIGKFLKMFTDKVEHTGKDGGPININATKALTKEQLMQIAARDQ